jgi:UPF0755 protein
MQRTSRRKIIVRTILLLLSAGIIVLVVGYLTIFGGNTPSFAGERSVYIGRNATLSAVTDSLVAAGVLDQRQSFEAVARATGWGSQVKAGHYTFAEGTSTYDILQTLRRGLQAPVSVVIPPGSRPDVVAAVVARGMEFEPQDFLDALADDSLAAALGTDTTHLFGYMLPETYNFYWLNDAETVVRRVKEYADELIAASTKSGGNGLGLSADEVVTVASIVEWESDLVDERPVIAGVYLNRLRDGWRLQADPTVQYAVIRLEGQKRRLYFKDYQVRHPYNTYQLDGLPPGPVTNPSPTSISAVLNPEAHKYYYFVARGDGGHIFSRTLAEHNRAAADYRRMLRDIGTD